MGYLTIKGFKFVKINSANLLILTFSKVNGYFEEINKSKYLMLVPTEESKKKRKFEELWSKIRDSVSLITKNSDDYDEKCVKIKFNSDNELPLNKTIEIPSMAVVVRVVLPENNKYTLFFFLRNTFSKASSMFLKISLI